MMSSAFDREISKLSNEFEGPGQPAPIERVHAEVAAWPGVTTHEHRFGGLEFCLGRRELGHLHRTFADIPLPRRLRDEIIAAGRARPHHVLPNSGWVSAPMRTASEAAGVIELLRLNYERAVSLNQSTSPEKQTHETSGV